MHCDESINSFAQPWAGVLPLLAPLVSLRFLFFLRLVCFGSHHNIRRSEIAIQLALALQVVLLRRLVLLVGARGIDQRDRHLQISSSAKVH
jgi:hypothetical protein